MLILTHSLFQWYNNIGKQSSSIEKREGKSRNLNLPYYYIVEKDIININKKPKPVHKKPIKKSRGVSLEP